MFAKSTVWTSVLGVSALGATAASAGTVTLEVEVPRLNVASYHKPYVAGWIEDASGAHKGDLFVWYDVAMKNKEGNKWLKDMRAWWRKSGRNLDMPVDGLSNATRAPGRHTLKFDSNHKAFKGLAAGDYVLRVEASREHGGAEVVKVPFKWDAKKASAGSVKGSVELGDVKFSYKP
ncbi:DUF2271 domain-containing protein [Asticcacaulis tiandongensis]|uniref:DUF2271 domain-containing protein n=1 Tax=Asticcacaulis tiandongensis TaxID=2565365 RepID=UPI00112BEFAA|nr:DUF2271 domain-containing protein [Asticcacaulis tiandongensis]